MKYKVGDKVRVKSREELLEIYEKTSYTLASIKEYIGSIVTISALHDGCYTIEEDRGCYRWFDQDFVDSAEETQTKITKLLLVEANSIDNDEIDKLTDLGIKVLFYRQGSTKPELINLEK